MSEHKQTENNPQGKDKKMVIAMGSIGLICALLIVLTYQGTFASIEKNKAEALEKAIFKVLPGISKTKAFQLNQDQTFSETNATDPKIPKVYAGYDSIGQLKGIAVQANGKGYGEVLNLLYGYDIDNQKIVGFYVLESKETPGIGDKIEKEDFLANFKAMDAALNDDFTKIKNEITTVKHGEKTNDWQIDGITGATITSRAVGNILSMSSNQWMPLIYKNKKSFLINDKSK
ncbi:MAG: RnfABCDGE type electron transport complex subunit G [Saprospiraceae bacterium]|nr:RnfABCDGE type electron transport complex subunit G [Saprospiraceae bacterium]